MAKRRKLEAPSAEQLSEIEEEFRRETSRSAMAPITQVAADAAALSQPQPAEVRARQAKIAADARAYDAAQSEGRVLEPLPTQMIEADMMVRDRAVIDQDDMMELRYSIAANGLRLPIEAYELEAPTEAGARYGLLSGYRRLMAVRALQELTGKAQYQTINCLVRPRTETADAFVAMVEENEVRADLSHFERGRIAVLAVGQGAFVNVEDAVGKLYATGSKSKRSKIRSFALIFEELGDMLHYPEALTEKQGLALAGGLRAGQEAALREALTIPVTSAAEEWAAIEAALSAAGPVVRSPARGGRPKAAPQVGWSDDATLTTSTGFTIRRGADRKGLILRIEGGQLDRDLVDSLMEEVRALLERP